MIKSLKETKLSIWCSFRKAAFQLGSVRNVGPSSPRAAGVRLDKISCANENAGPSVEVLLANNAARIRARHLIKGDRDSSTSAEGLASRPKPSIATLIMRAAGFLKANALQCGILAACNNSCQEDCVAASLDAGHHPRK